MACGKCSPRKLTPANVTKAVNLIDPEYAATTRSNILDGVRSLLRLLVPYGAPAVLQEIPPQVRQPEPRQRLVTQDERAAIFAVASLDLRVHLLFCGDLGFRAGSSVRICTNNWDKRTGVIRLDGLKHGGSVVLPLTRELEDTLRMVEKLTPFEAADVPYVVRARSRPSPTWRQSTTGTLQSILAVKFRRAAKVAGITDIRPHDFRRTAAEKLYSVTGDLRDVQSLLGHSDLRSSFHYLQRTVNQLASETLEKAKRA